MIGNSDAAEIVELEVPERRPVVLPLLTEAIVV
jgi:hypothetical protein